jgi:hypothetical protein
MIDRAKLLNSRKNLRDSLRRRGGPLPMPLVEKIAKVLCNTQGDFDWDGLRDIEGNPSTAYAYHQYMKMARAVIKKCSLRAEEETK